MKEVEKFLAEWIQNDVKVILTMCRFIWLNDHMAWFTWKKIRRNEDEIILLWKSWLSRCIHCWVTIEELNDADRQSSDRCLVCMGGYTAIVMNFVSLHLDSNDSESEAVYIQWMAYLREHRRRIWLCHDRWIHRPQRRFSSVHPSRCDWVHSHFRLVWTSCSCVSWLAEQRQCACQSFFRWTHPIEIGSTLDPSCRRVEASRTNMSRTLNGPTPKQESSE